MATVTGVSGNLTTSGNFDSKVDTFISNFLGAFATGNLTVTNTDNSTQKNVTLTDTVKGTKTSYIEGTKTTLDKDGKAVQVAEATIFGKLSTPVNTAITAVQQPTYTSAEKQTIEALVDVMVKALGNTRTTTGQLQSEINKQADAAATATNTVIASIKINGVKLSVPLKATTIAILKKAGVSVKTLMDDDGHQDLSALLADSGHHDVSALVDVSIGSDSIGGGSDSLIGADEMVLSATGSTDFDFFTVDLLNAGGTSVVLQDVDGATLLDAGRVRVDGNTPIIITSDNKAQNITGGGGNDTLVGTGNDTLTGGSGDDIFGFNASGKYVVTDFNKNVDKLAFDLAGVTTLDQLKAKVTSVTLNDAGITYNLGADSSITLIGVGAGELTADMIKLKILG